MTEHQFFLSDIEMELLPSDEDVKLYRENGWYVSKKLFTDEETDTLLAASERFYAGHRDQNLPSHPPALAYWDPSRGDVQRHNDYIHYEMKAISEILTKSIIGAVAARLADTSAIRVFQSTLIYKPPNPDEKTNLVPWHFDKHYWSTCSSEKMLTAFIPFHHCDERMGTITMVDGSHRWREIGRNESVTRHFANRDTGELEVMLRENADYNGAELRKIPMVIPMGHVSFHHCRTYHGSGPNLAAHPRRSISLHLQDADNHWHPYRMPDGSLLRYNHDYLVARDANGDPDYSDPRFCPVVWQESTG